MVFSDCAKHQPSDAAKAIDAYSGCHVSLRRIFLIAALGADCGDANELLLLYFMVGARLNRAFCMAG
jgi:hypothetical protein